MTTVAKQETPGLPVVMADMPEIIQGVGAGIERFAGKTVLITGAAGMLASYCVDALAYANHHVLSTPSHLILLVRSFPKTYSRLAHLLGRDDVTFLVQDVCEPLELSGQLDFIIHAASPASPLRFAEDPVGTLDANSYALRQLLALPGARGSEGFLFFSSSEVYGNPEPENIPTPETYIGKFDFTVPRSFYAESKRFGETLCKAFSHKHGMPTKVVRPFHVHGPGLSWNDGRIVADMIGKSLRGEQLKLASNGSATRTYGYISDATTGFLLALLNGTPGEAYNIGADQPEISILDLATTITQLCGRSDPVETSATPSPVGSPIRVCPDLTKSRKTLGYEPRVSLEQGLARTIEWFRAQIPAQLEIA